jgi:hypothetical protein
MDGSVGGLRWQMNGQVSKWTDERDVRNGECRRDSCLPSQQFCMSVYEGVSKSFQTESVTK